MMTDSEEDFHDHCRSCYDKFCSFYVVKDVSCHMTSCLNECGMKFHQCKQEDHDTICMNARISCINMQYGCPVALLRKNLSRHLEVCPASIVICTVEWNRWLRKSSLQSNNEAGNRAKRLQTTQVISSDFDISLAVHDQRILLETIMPDSVIDYYSKLADNHSANPLPKKVSPQKTKHSCTVDSNVSFLPKKASDRALLVINETNDSSHPGSTNQDPVTEQDAAGCRISSSKIKLYSSSLTDNLLGYSNLMEVNEGEVESSKGTEGPSSDDINSSIRLPNHIDTLKPTSSSLAAGERSLPYGGIFSKKNSSLPPVHSTSPVDRPNDIVSDFEDIDKSVKLFKEMAPHLGTLVNSYDPDFCIVLDVVDNLLNDVSEEKEDSILPILDWDDDDASSSFFEDGKKRSDELRESINHLMEAFGIELSAGSSNIPAVSEPTTKAIETSVPKKTRRLNSRFNFAVSWGFGTRREVVDACTQTDDLPEHVLSKLEWLSPEAILSRTDLISRMFSIIGVSYRSNSSLLEQKQTSPYISDSSAQTVAPFLLHIDMQAIGRALCSSTLTSSGINDEDRKVILSLLTKGKHVEEVTHRNTMSENLVYNNLVLESVMESLPRYQVKPTPMFSYMCGCLLRRDQFVSHVRNLHCDIYAGMNGWIEQRCPYAAYGCNYTRQRFRPDHHSNTLVYNQPHNSFVVRPGNSSDTPNEEISIERDFIHLPYEIHEKIVKYLDSTSINELSKTCIYLRRMCQSLLSSHGIVKKNWTKRIYEDGSNSWKLGDNIWSFSASFTEIRHWLLSNEPAMAQHITRCPVAAACTPDYSDKAKFSLTRT